MASRVDKIAGTFTKTISALGAEAERLDRLAINQRRKADQLKAEAELNLVEADRASVIAKKLEELISV